MKNIFLISLLLAASGAFGQGVRIQTWVVDGNGKPVAFPVYRACIEPTVGTPCNTPASIFSDRAMTSPLPNPATGDANSNIGFYAIQSRYHLQISGTGITAFDMPDIPAYDSTIPTVSTCVVVFAATPTFDPTTCTLFMMTLGGNVTSSTVSNPVLGRIIQFQLCEDGAGSRTFAWPSDFDSVPVIDQRASKCHLSAWIYNGTKWKMYAQGGDALSLPTGSVIMNGAAQLILPTTSDTMVGRATTDTLTGKTLNGDTLSGTTTNSGTIAGGTMAGAIVTTSTIGATNTVADGALSGNVALYNNGSKVWGGGVGYSWTFDASGGVDPFVTFGDNLVQFTASTLSNNGGDITASGNLIGLRYISGSANPAQSGTVRLANNNQVKFRNNAASADIAGLGADPSDRTVVGDSGGAKFPGFTDTVCIAAPAIGGAGNIRTYCDSTLNAFEVSVNGGAYFPVSLPVAKVDLTAQNAAVTTTVLYAVPAGGAGEYFLRWNAKVTTAAGTSSTLGALTIVYTDPDGVAITITAPAFISAGTVATTSTANTTSTVLLGAPLHLNCKASTNITYAFNYASNAANVMQYNLHMKLAAEY